MAFAHSDEAQELSEEREALVAYEEETEDEVEVAESASWGEGFFDGLIIGIAFAIAVGIIILLLVTR